MPGWMPARTRSAAADAAARFRSRKLISPPRSTIARRSPTRLACSSSTPLARDWLVDGEASYEIILLAINDQPVSLRFAGRVGTRDDGPQPPAGNPLEVVMAECDVVTIVHKNFRQDPTAAPGTWFEVFTFDTFRVRNGKLVEHWDGAVITPPAPAAGRGN